MKSLILSGTFRLGTSNKVSLLLQHDTFWRYFSRRNDEGVAWYHGDEKRKNTYLDIIKNCTLHISFYSLLSNPQCYLGCSWICSVGGFRLSWNHYFQWLLSFMNRYNIFIHLILLRTVVLTNATIEWLFSFMNYCNKSIHITLLTTPVTPPIVGIRK